MRIRSLYLPQQKIPIVIRRSALLVLLLCTISSTVLAQLNLKPGEITTASGNRIVGYIDFKDWSRNPEKIAFTIDPSVEPDVYRVWDVDEFTVQGQKYISRYVTIDETPFKVPVVRVTPRKSRRDRVFLRVLVDDDLSLYQYRDHRYNFYVEENDTITELISHEFVVKQRGRFVFVDTFKDEYIRQLRNLQSECDTKGLKKLDYNAERLGTFVTRCNGPDGQESGEFFSISDHRPKGKLRIAPYIMSGRYNIGYFVSRNTPVEITDPNGNIEFIEVESRNSEEVAVGAFSAGVELIYYLPGNLHTRALLMSVGYSPFVVENDPFFPDLRLMHFSFGYRYKVRSSGVQPFAEGGVSGVLRDSEYYDETPQEAFIAGIRIAVGLEYKRLYTALRGELHTLRTADIQHNGFTLSMGLQF